MTFFFLVACSISEYNSLWKTANSANLTGRGGLFYFFVLKKIKKKLEIPHCTLSTYGFWKKTLFFSRKANSSCNADVTGEEKDFFRSYDV